MPITPYHYVPVLRWRMGEYQALEKLDEVQKTWIVPLLEVLPPDFDFETQQPRKDLDEQLKAFGEKLGKKWGARPAFLDTVQIPPSSRVHDGRHPLTFLFDEAVAHGTNVTPVTALERDAAYQDAVKLIRARTNKGVALRCTLDEALDPEFDTYVNALLATLDLDASKLDLLLDLRSPAYDPQEGLISVIKAALTASRIFRGAGSVTLLGASFPESLAGVTGPIQELPRREWLLYKALLRELGGEIRRPGFGDYGIAAISFAQGDMRYMRGSPNIRYTIEDAWIIAKGKREKGNARKPYPGLCELIKKSGRASAAGFSAGSAYVEGCRVGSEKKCGSPTVWKWVGTNHHITKVVHDLARLRDS
jgi:hypothetical protein